MSARMGESTATRIEVDARSGRTAMTGWAAEHGWPHCPLMVARTQMRPPRGQAPQILCLKLPRPAAQHRPYPAINATEFGHGPPCPGHAVLLVSSDG